jgi:hypothetical protein
MVVELYKYMELSTEFSATAPYVLIGTGALIILVGSLACCCTVKGQPVLLYIVSNTTVTFVVLGLREKRNVLLRSFNHGCGFGTQKQRLRLLDF